MIDWADIDTVLLDMDGTLLDLHFDNHFWQEHVPHRFATHHGLTLAQARTDVYARYAHAAGTLNWYCVDYWTRELRLDIAALKQEVDQLIAMRPHVPDFLKALRARRKRIVLVTNAHGKAIDLKFARTALRGWLDAVVCAHDLGLPKEHLGFWDTMQRVEPFTRERALLIDDSLPVLRSARAYGISRLLAVKRPDSNKPDKDGGEFEAIASFRDIMP